MQVNTPVTSNRTNQHFCMTTPQFLESRLWPTVLIGLVLTQVSRSRRENAGKRWANSDAGQAAKMTNPTGFANVRTHAEAHLRAMQLQRPVNS